MPSIAASILTLLASSSVVLAVPAPVASGSAAPVSQISDGQPQAPYSTVVPVSGISDGQPQAPTAQAPSSIPAQGSSSASALAPPVSTVSASSPYSTCGSDCICPYAAPYLHDLATANGKLYFGTATDQPGTGEDTDIIYQKILNNTHIFGQVTPANGMKGMNTEPEVGVFNYTMGDVVVNIAQDHNKVLRCHNLIWSSQQPEWLTSDNYTWTRETLLPVMENHIKTLITHWADVCHAWDVVNEAFASNGSLSASPWLDIIGPDYLPLAFQYAHEAVQATGKDIDLYYNDYGIESPGNKTNAVYQLVRDLQAQGIQIAVGLEAHFTVLDPNTYANQVAVMSGLQDLGVTFALTELDVRFPTLPPNATYSYEAQAYRYWESVSACMQYSNCEGVTVWDFEDKYSWIPETFEGQGEADLYNSDYSRKPAYYAVAEALQGEACTVCGDVSQYQTTDSDTCADPSGNCN